MRNLPLLLTATLIFGASSLHGQDGVLAFGNGVWTNKHTANAHKELLNRRFKAYLLAEESTDDFSYEQGLALGLAYNQTACPLDGAGGINRTHPSCLLDLYEAWIQVADQEGFLIDEAIFIAGMAKLLTATPQGIAVSALVALIKKVAEENLEAEIEATFAQQMVELYGPHLGAGRKILLVAHSQGNLFGNYAYENIAISSFTDLVRMVSVASPAITVFGQPDPHVTVNNDIILLVPGRLGPTVANVPCSDFVLSWKCHLFDDTYMTYEEPRVQIFEKMVEELRRLDIFPEPRASLLANGDFAEGRTSWTFTPDAWAGSGPDYPNWHSPEGYAALGVDSDGFHINNANGFISQIVTLPADASTLTLSYWLEISTNETDVSASDHLRVEILDSGGSLVLQSVGTFNDSDGSAYQEYRKESFDISGLKGQTIQLRFTGTTDSFVTTAFRIDDVSITVE